MAVEANAYPRPRLQRSGPAPSSLAPSVPGEIATPPQSRVIPFALSVGAGNRSSASTTKLKGPAIVTGIHVSKGAAPVGVQGWGLGKSASPVTENNIANTTPKLYLSLLEPVLISAGASPSGDDADVAVDMGNSLMMDDSNLGLIVLDPEFHLVLTIYGAAGANGGTFAGHITLLEKVPPETIASFP